MPKQVIEIDDKWRLLRAQDKGPDRRANAAFFKKYPDCILARRHRSRNYFNGEYTHVVCAEPDCNHAIRRDSAERNQIFKCCYHAYPMYDGVRVRKPFIIEILHLIVKQECKGNYEYRYWIACQTPNCKENVEVSYANIAHRRHCVPCIYRQRADKRLAEQYEKLSEKFDIIGYTLKRVSHQPYPWQRLPRIVCLTPGCENHATLRNDHISYGLCANCARYREEDYRWAHGALIAAAAKRNIDVDLTLPQYVKLIKTTPYCYYCKTPVVVSPSKPTSSSKVNGKKVHIFSGHGLDRKDNAKGYSVENCVVCCGFHNSMKGGTLGPITMQLIALTEKGDTKAAIAHLKNKTKEMMKEAETLREAFANRRLFRKLYEVD